MIKKEHGILNEYLSATISITANRVLWRTNNVVSPHTKPLCSISGWHFYGKLYDQIIQTDSGKV